VHALSSVRAVEDALGIKIPTNARLIRNLIETIQYVQDHVIHFYALHALDFVDFTSALKADPAATSAMAQAISDWPKSSAVYFAAIQAMLQRFVSSGQLGPFANAYWGHPAYKLPPEANLMAAAHYLEALDWQREVIRAHAILGAKNPHLQTYLVGGMAIPVDPNSQVAINADKIIQLLSLFAQAKEFVEKVYLPDVLAIAPFYLDYAGVGEGLGNFMSYGDLPLIDNFDPNKPSQMFFPRGIILNRDLSQVLPLDPAKITENVTHSWFNYNNKLTSLHPSIGETTPNYTGPKPPYEFLNTDNQYSWSKAPRYDNKSMEVGPLARMLIAYVSGHKRVKYWVDAVLAKLGVPAAALFSTLGRTAARCVETLVLAEQLELWTRELVTNIGRGDLVIHEITHWDPSTWPAEAMGWGWTEAPRGALGHWVLIKDGKIVNYQVIGASTWNGSPRDANDLPGAYEAALVGIEVADPNKPLEILRTIHSFDPCMACAVHVLDAKGVEITRVTVKD
jgi:Ni,Fe-hydrogenase I large subunit